MRFLFGAFRNALFTHTHTHIHSLAVEERACNLHMNPDIGLDLGLVCEFCSHRMLVRGVFSAKICS